SVGLLICVYALSYAPALLDLELLTEKPAPVSGSLSTEEGMDSSSAPTEDGDTQEASASNGKRNLRPWNGSNAGLLFFLVLIVQLSDVFQYVWGRLLGHRVIAPEINASRTWEGFIGGVATTTIVGTLLWWATPFLLWQAACMSLIIAIMAFAGGMTMSAVKRDRGVADTGTLVQGHAGVLDRIDSICFAAPVFFHLTRYFFSAI
ncbi:MAG: phosphatidate cytidylyltransferase, partial [Pirellulaceae bacterium]|nr:phosphatidate cytidylyltransferase [Pirellulaceae bacterium]